MFQALVTSDKSGLFIYLVEKDDVVSRRHYYDMDILTWKDLM